MLHPHLPPRPLLGTVPGAATAAPAAAPATAVPAAKPLPPHLAALRDRLKTVAAPGKTLPLHHAIDAHLPADGSGIRGLPLAALHEFSAPGTGLHYAALPAAVAARLCARLPAHLPAHLPARPALGAILWLSQADDLYAPGLSATLDPGRIIFGRPRNDADTLGAAETALREGGFCAVILEAGRVDRVASRRLAFACQHHGATAFLIRRFPHGAAAPDREALAVSTRWRFAPAPSAMVSRDEPGPPRLFAHLTHARGGRPGAWLLESADAPLASHAQNPFRVVAPLAADTAAAAHRRVA